MNEKDAENLRDMITEIESSSGTEPKIIYFCEYETQILIQIEIRLTKERPEKTDFKVSEK